MECWFDSGLRYKSIFFHMTICKFCGKECKNRGLKQHERLCHKNPDRDMALTDILKKNGADTCRKINARIKNRNESTRRKREFVCQGCGKKFYLNLTDNEVLYKKYRNRRYCSPRCGKIYTKPTVISPDTRKKISEGCSGERGFVQVSDICVGQEE